MNSESTWTASRAEETASVSWLGALPMACAVHCLVTPVLVSIVPLFAVTHAFEAWLLGASALGAVASLATSWRIHGRSGVWWLAGAGFALWIGSLAGGLHLWPETAMSPLGSLLVAGALFWNGQLRHRATCGPCSCPAHRE